MVPPDLSDRDIAHHYTFTEKERELINRRRRDSNRLGFAVQLALLRFSGSTLMEVKEVPNSILFAIVDQISVPTSTFADYVERENMNNHLTILTRTAEGFLLARMVRGSTRMAIFDVADEGAVRAFFENIGDIDHILLAAGGPFYAPLAQMNFTEARRFFDSHIWPAMYMARYATPHMVSKGGAQVHQSLDAAAAAIIREHAGCQAQEGSQSPPTRATSSSAPRSRP